MNDFIKKVTNKLHGVYRGKFGLVTCSCQTETPIQNAVVHQVGNNLKIDCLSGCNSKDFIKNQVTSQTVYSDNFLILEFSGKKGANLKDLQMQSIKGTCAEKYFSKICEPDQITDDMGIRYIPDMKHPVNGYKYPTLSVAMLGKDGTVKGIYGRYLYKDGRLASSEPNSFRIGNPEDGVACINNPFGAKNTILCKGIENALGLKQLYLDTQILMFTSYNAMEKYITQEGWEIDEEGKPKNILVAVDNDPNSLDSVNILTSFSFFAIHDFQLLYPPKGYNTFGEFIIKSRRKNKT